MFRGLKGRPAQRLAAPVDLHVLGIGSPACQKWGGPSDLGKLFVSGFLGLRSLRSLQPRL